MCGWGKLRTTQYEETRSLPATFEEQEAKARYCASPLHAISPKKWANYRSHPSSLSPGPTLIVVWSQQVL